MRISKEARERFARYLGITRLGIIAIIGFAGSGKTEMLALTAYLFMKHPDIGKIHCSAPTHVATSNFAERLHRLGTAIAKETGCSPPLVVRGYAVRTEVSAFIKIASGKSRGADEEIADPYRTGRWSLKLSPCEWLLKVMGARNFQLGAADPKCLHDLREHVTAGRHYEGLRKFTAGDISFSEVESCTPDGAMKDTSFQLVMGLIEDIIMMADAVCTTPFGSSQDLYQKFNNKVAKGIILDEAGAMLQADALLVWGPGCRPCAMAGDPRQLPPTVMTHNEFRDGKCANVFSELARVSQLEQVRRSGWPCFVLNVQFRIVAGSFDLAREVIYPDVDDFAYASKAAVGANPLFKKIETWVRHAFKAPPCPEDKVLPLFFHCPESECRQDEDGGSRYNEGQNRTAVAIVEGLLGAKLGLKGCDVVVITPYSANFTRLQKAFSTHASPACREVVVNTTDSFQGREGMVVVFVLCVTSKTGPLFVADQHRICVGVTRQVGALFVVGDLDTLAHGAGTTKDPRKEIFRRFLHYFRQNKRVVRIDASRSVVGPGA